MFQTVRRQSDGFMKEVHIKANDAGQRLDKFLSKSFPQLKKSMMYKAIRNKKIKVNRKRCAHDQFLQEGDILLLFLPPDVLEEKNIAPSAVSQNRPLDIIYEDDDLIAVYKPAGLLSQKDSDGDQDSLNDRILAYLIRTGKYDPKTEHSFIPSVLHRLDRNTSGLVLAAKSARAARDLSEAIRENRIHKHYLAIAEGIPAEGEVRVWMEKEGTVARVFSSPAVGAREAATIFHVLQTSADRKKSLVEAELLTGRFHQIRATLAFLGTPIEGDHKYGSQAARPHQALQAYRIDLKDAHLGYGPRKIELPAEKRLHLQ